MWGRALARPHIALAALHGLSFHGIRRPQLMGGAALSGVV
jgi:hypothetical protein